MFWLRVLPMWVCTLLTWPIATLIFLLAKEQRRAVYANLLALFPEDGPLIAWLRGIAVFYQFGLTYMDRLWHLHYGRKLKWQPIGEQNLMALQREDGGALIFTVHSGNYDIGTSLFAEKLGRELHIVRVPERTESLQALRSAELQRINPLLHVHYNQPDAHLGLTLCQLLKQGHVVAVQGDRVVGEVSSVEAVMDGVQFRLPRGPLVLAEMMRVPSYPIFLYRTGMLTYAVEIHPSLCARGEALTLEELSARWLKVMTPFVRRHWDQWFVFERLLSPA